MKCPENTHFNEFGNCEYDFPDCGEDLILNEDNECEPIEYEEKFVDATKWFS